MECHVYAEGYQSCHQHSQPWGHSIIQYIHDVAGAQPPNKAFPGKRCFQALLHDLGLEENVPKGTDPATHITWLGVDFDMESMTMFVAAEKF